MIRWRFLPFYLFLIFSFFLLVWRLLALTIVEGAYYRSLAESNRTREIDIRAPRGVIYDRHGEVLARNIPVYKQCNNLTIEQCSDVLAERALEIEAIGGTESAQLKLDLGREYPAGSILAHVVGYVGEVKEDEISKDYKDYKVYNNYKSGDFIGRAGIEEQYESVLRGIDGKELTETDALGRKIKSLGKIEPIPGKNLTLTLDLDLQKIAAKEMEGRIGAVIISNPQTEEILSLYSSPSFDPGAVGEMGKLEEMEKNPFFDRVISGLYPPGSTFKIITAAAGLESGKITATTQIEDTGVISVGPFRFPNWYWLQYGKTDQNVDIIKALKRSNDIFFYRVGEMVGIEKLEEWAKKFGVGKILGIDLPGEAAGRFRLQRDWYLGDTYHMAIGQGDLEVTPLQVNFWTNVIANGGKLCRPHLANLSNLPNLANCQNIGLKKETIVLITKGMKEACATGGTGWPFFEFKIQNAKCKIGENNDENCQPKVISVACKTGTAEYGDPKGKTHAWFTIFAWPAEASAKEAAPADPEISVTVLVEGGGEGSNVAAPIAKKILEEWFGR